MRPNPVLVLSAAGRDGLVDALHHIGLDPLIRRTMQKALDEIVPERFVAVCVNRDRVNVDPLEFVLNVRDLDEQVPIIVAGGLAARGYERALTAQHRVFRFTGNSDDLEIRLGALLEDRMVCGS